MKETLNNNQLEAVTCIDDPVLVIAGPGSGKTRVIEWKFRYLVEKGYAPERILILTFNREAAREVKIRLSDIIEYPKWISTFHSFGLRVLVKSGKAIDIHTPKVAEGYQIIKIRNETNISRYLSKKIGLAKRVGLYPDQDSALKSLNFIPEDINKYATYQERLHSAGILDFEDLINYAIRLFKSRPSILKIYQEKFMYIMVDEFQDTSPNQYDLVKLLGQEKNNICVVGDVAQNIYSFRGSAVKNLENFSKDFKDAKIVILDVNYRSTPEILKAANSVFGKNLMMTDNKNGEKPVMLEAKSYNDEAALTVRTIEGLLKKCPDETIGVLYRINSQSVRIENELKKKGVRYSIEDLSFYGRTEVVDMVGCLKLSQNTKDDKSFVSASQLFQLKELEDIKSIAHKKQCGYFEAAEDLSADDPGIRILTNTIKNISRMKPDKAIEEILEKSGIKAMFNTDKNWYEKEQNIKQLMTISEDYTAIEDFLKEFSILSIESFVAKSSKVKLMTIHRAKGLEFDTVILLGVEENFIPFVKAIESNSKEQIEEEKRVFYVGLTRAKKRIFMTKVKRRPQSRFMYDIPEKLIEKRFF